MSRSNLRAKPECHSSAGAMQLHFFFFSLEGLGDFFCKEIFFYLKLRNNLRAYCGGLLFFFFFRGITVEVKDKMLCTESAG